MNRNEGFECVSYSSFYDKKILVICVCVLIDSNSHPNYSINQGKIVRHVANLTSASDGIKWLKQS